MKTALAVSLLIALGIPGSPALAQQGPSSRAVFRAADWFVVRATQTSGAVTCTGFHVADAGAQLDKDRLLVKLPAGTKSVGVRFDAEPARAPRALAKAEQEAGGLLLAGADFEQLRRSSQLGLDVATATGQERHVLKLEGLEATLKNIAAGCPLPAATAKAERARKLVREKAEREKCEPRGIARMREKGVPDWRIAATCPKAAPPAR